jgi:carbamoylphosphate synthase small subunit
MSESVTLRVVVRKSNSPDVASLDTINLVKALLEKGSFVEVVSIDRLTKNVAK